MSPSLIRRLCATGLVILAAVIVNIWLAPHATTLTAEQAGRQFENSDQAYAASIYGMTIAGNLRISALAVLAILVVLWWQPLGGWLAVVPVLLLAGAPAHAYYDKSDYTEAVTIYPNETAFWIPDTGGNKDSQGKMDSAEYYQNNKIALKRFIVPHTQLSGSGWGPWGNYFVPAGRMILVDRTPYNREWVKDTHRGTSSRDESFPCQDSQGHDVTVEITIGTSVLEENAAKFLYRFGVKPPQGNRTDPQVIFTSVYYGRNLTEVMDSVGRGAIQALVCSEISTRDLDHVNSDAAAMLVSIKTAATTSFAAYGITLDYIGWAGTFTFADGVQDAINRRYIAEKDQQIATMLAPLAPVIQQLAAADALRAFATRTDGKLPTTIVGLPASVGELLREVLTTGQSRP